jgi:hypothetical protein
MTRAMKSSSTKKLEEITKLQSMENIKETKILIQSAKIK